MFLEEIYKIEIERVVNGLIVSFNDGEVKYIVGDNDNEAIKEILNVLGIEIESYSSEEERR